MCWTSPYPVSLSCKRLWHLGITLGSLELTWPLWVSPEILNVYCFLAANSSRGTQHRVWGSWCPEVLSSLTVSTNASYSASLLYQMHLLLSALWGHYTELVLPQNGILKCWIPVERQLFGASPSSISVFLKPQSFADSGTNSKWTLLFNFQLVHGGSDVYYHLVIDKIKVHL